MWKTDEDLRTDLEDAFSPEGTDDEFTTGLREALARGSGGEHEVSVPIDRRRLLWTGAGLAAAACLLLAFLLVPRSDPEVGPAADGIPKAKTGVAPTGNLPIEVAKDGSITIDGETAKTGGVYKLIEKVVAKRRRAGAEKLRAIITADRATRWQAVHDVLKGLAKAKVPAELSVADENSGKPRALPVPLPDDPALSERPEKPPVQLVLSRGVDETRTWVEVNGLPSGTVAEGALGNLARMLAGSGEAERKTVRIEAFAAVPLSRVVHLIDIVRGAKLVVQGISINAPAHLTVKVNLHQKGKETTVWLPWLKKTVGLEEALKALEQRIRILQNRGRKVHGLVDSAVYIDRKAVERILAVYRKAGIENVMMIH